MSVRVLDGDCRALLSTLAAESVQTCVTSPPYFGLRDYGVAGQIGLEATPDAFVAELVAVFRDVRRVLRDDGTLWLNLGDSYTGSGKGGNPEAGKQATNRGSQSVGSLYGTGKTTRETAVTNVTRGTFGIGAKQLLGMPWRVAFALQSDGWILRADIVWEKPSVMPESVTDRPTRSHEYVFLLAKNPTYYYDADAIAEPAVTDQERESVKRGGFAGKTNAMPGREAFRAVTETRNRRTVWTVPAQPFKGAHFATFPPALIEPCILAGSRRGDTVLDPFGGAGTTGLVADRLGRDAILCELNPEYAAMARARITNDNPLFGDVA